MLSNYSRSSFKLFGIIIAIIFLSISSSNTFGQNEQKSVKKLFCMVDKDHYFIKGTDRGEVVLEYATHMLVFHNMDNVPDKQIDSLLNAHADMKPNSELKTGKCLMNDEFEIYSSDEEEMLSILKTHIYLNHKKELSNDELKKLVNK